MNIIKYVWLYTYTLTATNTDNIDSSENIKSTVLIKEEEDLTEDLNLNTQDTEKIAEIITKRESSEPQMFLKDPRINMDDFDSEDFYLTYLCESIAIAMAQTSATDTNVANIKYLLFKIKNTSIFSTILFHLVNQNITIIQTPSSIKITNGATLLFDKEIIYKDENSNEFIIILTEIKYNLLIQLLTFLNQYNHILEKKYLDLLHFLKQIKIEKYIKTNTSTKNILPSVNVIGKPLQSPITVTKTIPNLYKGKLKNRKPPISIKDQKNTHNNQIKTNISVVKRVPIAIKNPSKIVKTVANKTTQNNKKR